MTELVWTRYRLDVLCAEYPKIGGIGVAKLLGLDPKQVYDKARYMGIRIEPKDRPEKKRCRPRGRPFSKGRDERRGPGVPFRAAAPR